MQSMKAGRLRRLCVEIYESINPINPSFMNEIFRLRMTNSTVRSQCRLNLDIRKVIVSFGSKIWSSKRSKEL